MSDASGQCRLRPEANDVRVKLTSTIGTGEVQIADDPHVSFTEI
jgi:hypothetical protein